MKDIVLLDGACGTCLYEKAAKRGIKEKPVWMYSLEAPDMVEELAKEYIAAGTRIIQTNTFNANSVTVEREGFNLDKVIKSGIDIAKSAVFGTECKVSLDIGPLTMHLEPYGDLSEGDCRNYFKKIISAAKNEGIDLITIETFMDLSMLKLAAAEALETGLPVFCSMTFQEMGKTLFGNTAKDIAEFANEYDVSAIGSNCSFGPKSLLEIVEQMSQHTDKDLLYKPNADAGLSAKEFADLSVPAFEKAKYIGACCNSNPDFIRELSKEIK